MVGDFNAKLGKYKNNQIKIIGNYGLGIRKERSERLINYLENENLYCMNSFYQKLVKRRCTWISPNLQAQNGIDYMITNTRPS